MRYGWAAVTAAMILAACGDNGHAPQDAAGVDAPSIDAPCTVSLAALPTSLSFGVVHLGLPRAPAPLVIENAGSCPTGPLAMSIVGTNAGDFAIVSSSCDGHVIAPGATCTVMLQFRPAVVGDRTGQLRVDGSGTSVLVPLDGTGSTAPLWSLQPASHAFGDVAWHTTSPSFTFTVAATGGYPSAGPPAATLAGAYAGEFAITADTCATAALPVGGSCGVVVAFQPTSLGPRSVSLVVMDPSFGLLTAEVSGTGVKSEGLSLSPMAYEYGGVRIGSRSVPTRFTLTNHSASPVPGTTTATLGGSQASQFGIVADYCTGATIAPGATCDVWIDFHPTGIGPQAAAVTMSDPQLAGVTASLSGTAFSGGGNFTVMPSTFDFGTVASGTRQLVMVTNTSPGSYGPIATMLTGIHPASYRIANDTCAGATLAPGASCSLEIETTCAAPGIAQYASVTLVGGGDFTIAVKGTVSTASCP